MNDESGWYLPYLIDGYIDIHGSESVEKAVEDVVRGVVDPILCGRLSWYISYCGDMDGEGRNKCYYNFPGSYVNSSSNVYRNVQNYATYFYFGFSEKFLLKMNRIATAYLTLRSLDHWEKLTTYSSLQMHWLSTRPAGWLQMRRKEMP